jgi:hypothetical protein
MTAPTIAQPANPIVTSSSAAKVDAGARRREARASRTSACKPPPMSIEAQRILTGVFSSLGFPMAADMLPA